MRYRLWILVFIVPLVAACAAAGGRSISGSAATAATVTTGSGGLQALTVKATEMDLTPARISIKAGQPVQLTFENNGHVVHDFTLSQGVPTRFQLVAQSGQRTSGTFTVSTPGTYSFICAQPGHESAGMRGELRATE